MNSVAFYALQPKVRYVYPPKVELYRRLALCDILRGTMPAIASLEELKAAQKDGVSIYAMLSAGCWQWTPEQLKGEDGYICGRC
jgi:hypothetical protein